LSAGTYVLSVTDANDCLLIDSVSIFTVDCEELSLNTTFKSNSCFEVRDAFIDVDIINGWEPINISWSNGSQSNYLSELEAGAYTITVVDDYGCTIEETYTIITPEGLTITLDNIQHLTDSTALGAVNTTITGGTEPYQILWTANDFQATTEDIDNLLLDCYHMEVTDINGCNTSLDICIADLTTGVESINELNRNVHLFPNPTSGKFEVQIDIDYLKSAKVSMIDVHGKLIRSFETRQKNFELDISDVTNGVYLLQLEIDGLTVYKKIQKQD